MYLIVYNIIMINKKTYSADHSSFVIASISAPSFNSIFANIPFSPNSPPQPHAK